MSTNSKIVLLAVCIAVWLPHLALALPYTKSFTPRLSVQEIIVKQAQVYATPAKPLLDVSKCESTYNPTAIGDRGTAYGIFQYHRATFDRFAALMGEQLDYYSYYDQAKVTAFIFANYPQYKNNWTCAIHLGYVQ